MLTEEQKKKIELNKRKALEKLRQRDGKNNTKLFPKFTSVQEKTAIAGNFSSSSCHSTSSFYLQSTIPKKTTTSYSPTFKKQQSFKQDSSISTKSNKQIHSTTTSYSPLKKKLAGSDPGLATSPSSTRNIYNEKQTVRSSPTTKHATSYNPFNNKTLDKNTGSIVTSPSSAKRMCNEKKTVQSPPTTKHTTSYSPFKKKTIDNGTGSTFASLSSRKQLFTEKQSVQSIPTTKHTTSFSPFKKKTIDNGTGSTIASPSSRKQLFTEKQSVKGPPTIGTSNKSVDTLSYSPFKRKLSDDLGGNQLNLKVGCSPSNKNIGDNLFRMTSLSEKEANLKNKNNHLIDGESTKYKSSSYCPAFKKQRMLQFSEAGSQSDQNVIDCIDAKTKERSILSYLEGGSQQSFSSNNDQTKERAEMNRLRALEKLKNKNKATQNVQISTSQAQLESSQENKTIEVNFFVNSPTWFRMECDAKELIKGIVQKIKNRNFDKGSWLFHIKDYKQVVTHFEGINNIKIKEHIPTSTVRILQMGHSEQNRKPLEKIDISRIDSNILEKLMPFQKDGVKFAVQKKGRVLIADDMGLGKTIQAIAICNYYVEDWPVLIICPSSVKMSWQQHFLTWMPALREDDVAVIHTGKERISSTSITIMSCDLASKFAGEIQTHGFQVIIVDESHSLKNSQAKRTKCLLPILQDSKRTILLSGTPALSRPKELYTQISALRRDLFKSYFKFAKRYCDAKEGRYGLDDDGCSNSDELNAVLKSTVMLRRMKYEVLDQLPPKMRTIAIIDPSLIKITKELKDNERAFVASKGKKDNRGPLLQYYASSAQAKVKGVVQFVLEKIESTNEKIIVFAHHVHMLDKIEEETRNKNIESIRISGNTSSKARQALVDLFNQSESCKLAILSLTAAGIGLNMTASSLVIFAELYWNPGHLIQAEDRTYRIGQKNSVSIIYLVAKKTADDYMWPLVKNKLNVLTTLGVGTKQGLGSVQYTETKRQTKISDFCQQSQVSGEELDHLFANLQDDDLLDDNTLMELSEQGCPR